MRNEQCYIGLAEKNCPLLAGKLPIEKCNPPLKGFLSE